MATGARDNKAASGVHFAALDGLRGLAILLVLFVHFIGDEIPRSAIERAMVKAANYGVWGVDLFFVLSGFLITGILHDAKNGPGYFKNFYARRTLRIFPLYFGVLFLLFGVLPLLPLPYPRGLAESAHHQGWLWTYLCNVYVARAGEWALPYVSHFWSLAVEEHFYLIWPAIVLAFTRGNLLRICVLLSAFSLVLRVSLAFAGVSDVALTALTPCRLDSLCIGAFLALSVREVGLDRVAQKARFYLLPFAAVVLFLSVWNAASGGLLRAVAVPLRTTFVSLFFGALLVSILAAPREAILSRIFHTGALRSLGKYSYGLYVFHGVIAYAFQDYKTLDVVSRMVGSHLAAMILQASCGMAISLLCAVLSYELFEKQFLRLKDRFAPQARPAVARTLQQPS